MTRNADAVVLALATDHVVAACEASLSVASSGHIVTFGVKPERPATEYGYISLGDVIDGCVHSVVAFVEKPDPAMAARNVANGYLWNSGNFMFRADALLEEYRAVDGTSVDAVTQAIDKAERDLAFVILDGAAPAYIKYRADFYRLRRDGKDSSGGRPPGVVVGPTSVLGMPYGNCHRKTKGNAARGAAVFENSRNCNLSSDRALVALEGVDDLVVVSTQDAVLVSRQSDANGLKWLVAKLKSVVLRSPRIISRFTGHGGRITRSTSGFATR